jgi:hypothetical protein
MRNILLPALLIAFSVLSFSLPAHAEGYRCDKHEGDRMDFDVPSGKFVFKHLPSVDDYSMDIRFDEDGTHATIVWNGTDAKTKKKTSVEGTLMRIRSDEKAVDYTGEINGVAALVTFFPQEKAVIYSEHSYNRSDAKRTGRGKIFGMNCK